VAKVLAAGAVLWRPGTAIPTEIAIVHRPRYDDWSLPKGKLEPGESIQHAAAREVLEETGFAGTLGRHLGQRRYPILHPVALKVVDYFAARCGPGSFHPNKEVDELRWVAAEEAGALLTHRGDREIVAAFRQLPPDTTTLALVRHAKAGNRASWKGTDELRPLSGDGWKQAEVLRSLLPLYGVDRVHAAPLLRCAQTVQAVAEDLGVAIVDEPLLAEKAGQADSAAVARVLRIATAGGTPVVCSQGGVIPALLTRIAEESGLPLRRKPPSAKGSTWILSFTGSRLVAADYVPKPAL
jgi:8-oxo-dGTP pyrophosphatase MutT (NUDIX family)/phosphohistidine phosphatase SixA